MAWNVILYNIWFTTKETLWYNIWLNNQPQLFNLDGMLPTAGDGIDAGGVDAAVAQDVGQLGDIPMLVVVASGK